MSAAWPAHLPWCWALALSWPVGSATSNYWRLEAYPEAFTSPVLQARVSKLLCSRPVSGAYLCPAGRWPYSCCVLPRWSDRILASASVTRALNPLGWVSTLITQSLPRVLPPNAIRLGVRAFESGLGEADIQSLMGSVTWLWKFGVFQVGLESIFTCGVPGILTSSGSTFLPTRRPLSQARGPRV